MSDIQAKRNKETNSLEIWNGSGKLLTLCHGDGKELCLQLYDLYRAEAPVISGVSELSDVELANELYRRGYRNVLSSASSDPSSDIKETRMWEINDYLVVANTVEEAVRIFKQMRYEEIETLRMITHSRPGCRCTKAYINPASI